MDELCETFVVLHAEHNEQGEELVAALREAQLLRRPAGEARTARRARGVLERVQREQLHAKLDEVTKDRDALKQEVDKLRRWKDRRGAR